MSNVTLTGFYAGYLFADNNSTLTNIGTVSTGYYGMSVTGSGDTVVNAGLIAGDVYDGLVFKGSVVNQLGGTISGGRYGVASSTAVAIDNAGTIIGTAKAGAYLQANSTVTNQSTGIILGGGVGISAGSGTAIDNAGTIYGVGKAGIDIGPSGFIANRSVTPAVSAASTSVLTCKAIVRSPTSPVASFPATLTRFTSLMPARS